ncbi:S8/S53 family peptidase [Thermogemmatispora sp.]|uniref:S8/S53 family peptidase n=1 Tax=Thermogemmatispora sp. TaxID=1968838 RepID=UPI001DD54055|nr:S8/S53 family peptidase [Thermogemmatispora sp.]MBX5449706.1 S8/S53 family peptidase [Thermogemmatispora sp.]
MTPGAADLVGRPTELFYWVRGEMVVVVQLPRRPAEDALELLAEQVRSQLNALLEPHHLMLEPYGSGGRWQEGERPPRPPIRKRAFLFGYHRQQPLVAIFYQVRHLEQALVDPMPLALAYLQVHLEELAERGLRLVSIMPNWLVTAAPFYYSVGGPALPPRPAPRLELPAIGASEPPLGWHISFLDQGLLLDPEGANEVLVAVLDTAVEAERLLKAAERPEFRRNWLLQRLAADLSNDSGLFQIEYDRYPLWEAIRTGRDRYGEALYYPMPDHGLFVAGLIRDIAPQARIRLIRVLNDYGGGDLYGLFAALTGLEKELFTGTVRRLVVNLSLTTLPDARRLPYIWFDDRRWPSRGLASAMSALSLLEEGLRLLFESLYAQGALLVAAAGNDSWLESRQGKRRRPPRAPARYATVVSVTSVNSRFEPSQFANAAAMPPVNGGVATFGGDVEGVKDSNDLPDAVRGVYISPSFPNGEPNTTGWADWSGSSFAAPIVSGLAAHLLAQGWSASNTMLRMTSSGERHGGLLYGSPPEVPILLANLIRAQQRFGL